PGLSGVTAMRRSRLCADGVGLELYIQRGVCYAAVAADDDFEEREAVSVELESLASVLHGLKCHLAGPGWLCSIGKDGAVVELDLWRDGYPSRTCRVGEREFETALQ